uniref:Uncharacterized protein n=1 Tax=Anguilla anguilla TaxID=7936 RepID=A0A0E9QXY3_ANGAN
MHKLQPQQINPAVVPLGSVTGMVQCWCTGSPP